MQFLDVFLPLIILTISSLLVYIAIKSFKKDPSSVIGTITGLVIMLLVVFASSSAPFYINFRKQGIAGTSSFSAVFDTFLGTLLIMAPIFIIFLFIALVDSKLFNNFLSRVYDKLDPILSFIGTVAITGLFICYLFFPSFYCSIETYFAKNIPLIISGKPATFFVYDYAYKYSKCGNFKTFSSASLIDHGITASAIILHFTVLFTQSGAPAWLSSTLSHILAIIGPVADILGIVGFIESVIKRRRAKKTNLNQE